MSNFDDYVRAARVYCASRGWDPDEMMGREYPRRRDKMLADMLEAQDNGRTRYTQATLQMCAAIRAAISTATPCHIGQTIRVAGWIDGRIQSVRVEFTRIGECVRLQAMSARPLGDMQLSFGRRYCVVLGEAEWLTQPATYGR